MVRYSSKNADVIEAARHFNQQLLTFGTTAESILDACKQYDDEFILHIYAAIFYAYGQTDDCTRLAKEHLQKALLLKKNSNEQEQLLFDAVSSFVANDYQKAIDLLYRINQGDRSDLLALKFAEFCFYCLGQQFEARQYLNYTQFLLPYNKNDSDFLAMHSFANELSGNYELALKFANQSLEYCPSNAWAHHCLSHVYLRQKKLAQAIESMKTFEPFWHEQNSTILSHNLWHFAIFYLEKLQYEDVKSQYERYFSRFDSSMVCINIDKISLFWRIELSGRCQDEKWLDIAKNIEPYCQQHYMPFINAHFIYALARAGMQDVVTKVLNNYKRHAAKQNGFYHRNWDLVGYHLLQAIVSFVNEKWDQCCELMKPYINIIGCVGGSDAQIDVFKQTYLVALIKAKRNKEAKAFLYDRAQSLPLTPLESSWAMQIKG
jgi:tetratricopeptide (TPR) repeat protein